MQVASQSCNHQPSSKTQAWSLFETQWRSAAASHQQQSLTGSQLDCCMVVVAGKAEAMTQSEGDTRVLMQFFGMHLNQRSKTNQNQPKPKRDSARFCGRSGPSSRGLRGQIQIFIGK